MGAENQNSKVYDTSIKIDKLAVHEKKSIKYIDYYNILYLKADRSYTVIHYREKNGATIVCKSILTSTSLNHFEQKLLLKGFVRVHCAYIVNSTQIIEYVKSPALIKLECGTEIPVSRSKKDLFTKF